MIKIAERPAYTESYTIWRPSGDQRGVPTGVSGGTAVSVTVFSPAAFASRIWRVPERFETNTTDWPLGEYSGLSVCREEKRSFAAFIVALPSERASRQT